MYEVGKFKMATVFPATPRILRLLPLALVISQHLAMASCDPFSVRPPQSLRISPWARSQIHAVTAQADSRCTGIPATRPPNHGAPTRPADRRPPMDKGGQHSSAAALLQLVEAGADELVPADSSRA